MKKSVDFHTIECCNCGGGNTLILTTSIDEVIKKVTVEYEVKP